MLSALYFEKQSDYIRALNIAAEIASSEDVALKRSLLKYASKSNHPQFTSTRKRIKKSLKYAETSTECDEIDGGNGSLSVSMLSNNCETKQLLNDNALDKTFVSTIMGNILQTKSTPQILNRSSGELNLSKDLLHSTTDASKGQYSFTRRPSFVSDDSIVLAAAASRNKNLSTLASGKSNRPVSFPQAQGELIRRKTCSSLLCPHNCNCYIHKQDSDVTTPQAEDRTTDISDNKIVCPMQTSQASAKDFPQVEFQGDSSQQDLPKSRKVSKKSHDMYYSLSPLFLSDGLKSPQGRQNNPRGQTTEPVDMVIRDSEAVASESGMLSQDSSLSSNPEYFSVLSKDEKKRRRRKNKVSNRDRQDSVSSDEEVFMEHKKKKSNQDVKKVLRDKTNLSELEKNNYEKKMAISMRANNLTSIGRNSPISMVKKCDLINEDKPLSVGMLNSPNNPSDIQKATTDNENLRHNADDSMTIAYTEDVNDISFQNSLLYATGFNIDDYTINSDFGEGDFIEDGYCKCSFCNHEMIYTQGKGEMMSVTDAGELASPLPTHKHCHLRRSRNQLSNTGNKKRRIVSLKTSELLTTSLPVDILSPEPSDSEDYGILRRQFVKPSDMQQSLQLDIEKHSDGVASVMSLCNVLLYDGDACSSEGDKESIEYATNSLGRRWKNICALSMERKLKIEETRDIWKRFMDDFARFKEWMRASNNTLQNPNTRYVSYTVARQELRKYENFQRSVHESLTQLELINKQYRKLARENRTDSKSKLKSMVSSINLNWDELSVRLTSILRRLKHHIGRREQFESLREKLMFWLTEIDLQLTNVEHFMQVDNTEKYSQIKVNCKQNS